MWSCDNIVHHACCTEWYNKQGLPDSDSNQAYCWTCIKKNYPERCGGGDGDDGGDGDGGDGIGVGGGIGGGGGDDVAGGGGGSAAAAARRAKRGNAVQPRPEEVYFRSRCSPRLMGVPRSARGLVTALGKL